MSLNARWDKPPHRLPEGSTMGENAERTWCVYMHTAPNGKRYIGITSQKPKKRFASGKGYKGNKHFYGAIQQVGWENIRHEIIASGMSKDEACDKERELIARYKTTNPENGYNLTSGGECYEFSEDVIKRLRRPKNISEETRQELAARGREAYERYLKGRVMTAEQIEKMAQSKRGKKQPRSAVEKRAASMRRHFEEQGYSEEHKRKISEALKGRTFTAETLEKMKEAKSPENNPRSRRVAMIKDGEVVSVYCSAREAMRETGISYTSIVRVCNHVRLKQAGGYRWEYV